MFVKICGIKDPETAAEAGRMGADVIGVIAHKKSRRYITPEQARGVKEAAGVPVVAVGVTLDECLPYADIADYFQADDANSGENHILSGSTEPEGTFLYFLYDASRGAGIRSDYPGWVEKYRERLILAGGLTPENVADVIRTYRPFGVDVSSGVETDGEKDLNKIEDFIKRAKNL